MKKLAIIIFSVFIFQWVSAQYCDSVVSFVCSTSATPDSPGLYPRVDSFPSFYNHFLTSAIIQFRNFDTILFGDEVLPVYSLKWDTIENLPPGLCWTTDQTNNTYTTGQAGCIHIGGKPCGPTGQYKLSTLVTVDIGIPFESDGDPGGLKYFVRLQNYGDPDIPVDTTQTDSMPYIPYGGICQTLTPPVVSLGASQIVCAGSIVTLNPVITGGQPPYTYLWQSAGSTIICATCASPSVTITENSEYLLKVTDASGGFGYDSVYYSIAGTPYNFQITATEPDIFCGGGTVTISANANDSVSFQWNGNGNNLAGETGNVLTVTDSTGAYYLIYTEAGVCQATSNIIHLTFFDTTAVTISSLSSDTICVGGGVTLVANAIGEGLNYAWLADDTSLNYTETSLDAVDGGIYQIVVTNALGCIDTSAPVLVVASPDFPATLSYSQFISDTLCNNTAAITLAGAVPPGGYYSGTGVSGGIFNPPAASAGLNFIYYNYVDSTGCGSTTYDTVVILICTDISEISQQDNILLYPNPGTDQLTVQSDMLLQDNMRILVYDITGKKLPVSYQRQARDKFLINISNLAAGCYSIQIQTDAGQISRRFIKMD